MNEGEKLRQITIHLHDGSTLSGWDYGDTPLGWYVALDRDAREIRFIPKGTYSSAGFAYDDMIEVPSIVQEFYGSRHEPHERDSALAADVIRALDRVDFNVIRRISKDFGALRRVLRRSVRSARPTGGPPRDEPDFPASESEATLDVRYRYFELLDEFERSGILPLLKNRSDTLRRVVLPPFDWEMFRGDEGRFDLEREYMIASAEPGPPEDGGRQSLRQVSPEKIVHALEYESADRFEDKPPDRVPKRLRIIAAAGRIAFGGGLAAANIAGGITAGVVSALPTLGMGAIAGAVTVAGSAYTGLNGACEGIKDLATALETK